MLDDFSYAILELDVPITYKLSIPVDKKYKTITFRKIFKQEELIHYLSIYKGPIWKLGDTVDGIPGTIAIIEYKNDHFYITFKDYIDT